MSQQVEGEVLPQHLPQHADLENRNLYKESRLLLENPHLLEGHL
jgi:hypothetical protein